MRTNDKSSNVIVNYLVIGFTIVMSILLLVGIVILSTDVYNKIDTYNLPSAIEIVLNILINSYLYVLSIFILFGGYFLLIPAFIVYSVLIFAIYFKNKRKDAELRKLYLISLVISIVNIILAIVLFYFVNNELFDIMLTN